MAEAIRETDFALPGQIGDPYHGKVGDVYTIEHEMGTLLVVVRTDRISAFDEVLGEVPHKGQVLNEISAALLEATRPAAPNWFLASPDPNVSVGFKADAIPVEMIVRGCLLGTAWRNYRDGGRAIGGNQLPEGMVEFGGFTVPIITPTTKAHAGHDEDTTPPDIIASGVVTADEYATMERLSRALFAIGQTMAAERGLLLADTKYEFGRLATGQIVLIDEVHTPDSSRYLSLDEHDAYVSGATNKRPEQLSKEFVREWLIAHGFSGQAGEVAPTIPEEFIDQITARYINLYERMLGRTFVPAAERTDGPRTEQIRQNIVRYLAGLSLA
jgi:phosphoribosylaminoimidazole-succinocarboxamide synthase